MPSIVNYTIAKNVARQIAESMSMDIHRSRKTRLLCKQCNTVQRVITTAGAKELKLECGHSRPPYFRHTEDVEAIARLNKKRLVRETPTLQVFEEDYPEAA